MYVVTLLALVALQGAVVQDLDREVSLSYAAMPAGKLLRQIGDDLELGLTAAPPLSEQVLLVHVDKATIKEVMERVATALYGEWTQTRNGYLLHRTPALQRRLEEEDLVQRAKLIEENLKKDYERYTVLETPQARVEALSTSIKRIEEEMRRGSVGGDPIYDTPARQLLVKLMHALGPRELARSKVWDQAVYSSSPNAAQLPLPENWGALLEEFSQTEESLRLVYDAEGPKSFLRDPAYVFGSAHDPEPVEQVIVQTLGAQETLNASIFLYTRGGRLKSTVWLRYMHGWGWIEGGPVDVRRLEESLKHAGSPHKIPVAAVMADFTRMFQGQLAGVSVAQLSPFELVPAEQPLNEEARQALLHPERIDPLEVALGEPLRAYAAKQGKNLIAALPDRAFRSAQRCIKDGQFDVGQLIGMLPADVNASIEEASQWIVIRPLNPVEVERWRLPRESLGRMARAGWTEGKIRLRDYFKFHWEAGHTVLDRSIWPYYERLLVRDGVEPALWYGFMPPKLGALFGSLNEQQWQQLLREGSIGTTGLSKAQRELLWQAPVAFYRSEDSELSLRYGQPKSDLADIMLQPTVSLLTVPQDQIRLVLRAREQAIVQDKQGELGWWLRRPLTLRDVGRTLALEMIRAKTEDITQVIKGSFHHGVMRGYVTDIFVHPGMTVAWEMYDRVESSPEALPYGQLPEEVQRALRETTAKELAEMRRVGG
jgi:hypothetical protein